MSGIIDQICARAAVISLSALQQQLLADWEAADNTLGARPWTREERQEAADCVLKNPDFAPTAMDLAKFGSVDSLFSRYDGLLRRCEQQGLLTPIQVTESAEMARSGRISLAQTIREGKELKAWLEETREAAEVVAAFAPRKVLEPA